MKFSSVIGQAEVKKRLIHAASERRVSHALLFLGPEGSGNLPVAVAFAQYLVCENPSETDSCGICPGCKKMEKLGHPDVSYTFPVASKERISEPKSSDFMNQWREAFLSDPYLTYTNWMDALELENKQGSISVHESSDIVNRLSLRNFESPYRIVIIWFPELMNTFAANKLLKILEEPPENTLFFLVAENYEFILPTIASRTQLIKVNRIEDQDMLKALTEKHGLDQHVARRVVHMADGNYNDALQMIQDDDKETNLNQQFLQWMRYCLKMNVKGLNEMSQQFGNAGKESQKNFLRHALTITRECLLLNYGKPSLVKLDGKDLEDIARFSPFVNEENIHAFTEELNKAHYHLERNANSKLLFLDLSFCMYRHLSTSK